MLKMVVPIFSPGHHTPFIIRLN